MQTDVEQRIEMDGLFEMWWNGNAPLLIPLREDAQHIARGGFDAGYISALASIPAQIEAAVQAEREECEAEAMYRAEHDCYCEPESSARPCPSCSRMAKGVAAAIRARGEAA